MDIVAGTSMFVSRDYIKTVGVMDEDFFVYYEDTDWSLRRGKFRLGYAHDSVVRHVAGSTSGSGGPRPKRSRFSIYLSERNRVLIAKKCHPAAWPVFALAALVQSFELLIRFRSPRSFQFALDGWWAGLAWQNRHARLHARQTGGCRQGLFAAGRLTRAASRAKAQVWQNNGDRFRPLSSSNVKRAIDFRQ